MSKILITGGTGTIGSHLTKLLLQKGHEVSFLSRRSQIKGAFITYEWNIKNKMIDPKCLEGVDAIVHLAGAPVAAQRWTPRYKKEIFLSRVQSTQMLYHLLASYPHQVKTFIGGSAVGFYGNNVQQEADENSQAGSGFLARVCKRWEQKTMSIASIGIRTVIIRTGVVLNKENGFFPPIVKAAKLFLAVPPGCGVLHTPWIHIDDLCHIFYEAIINTELHGVYNAVAPEITDSRQLMKLICKAVHRPMWPLYIPAGVLHLLLGEVADVILADQHISSKKIIDTGFKFRYSNARDAIDDLVK